MRVRANVGVLALQGDVVEHLRALDEVGVHGVEVRSASDLARVDALVIPGGESTTVIRLLDRFELSDPIIERTRADMPLWGTCMGMIIAARNVADLEQRTLNLLDVTVRRNAFGRQVASAEVDLPISVLGAEPFPAIFIRAPWIERAGPNVTVLAQVDGHGVFVREGNVMGTSFHPELTRDRRVHDYFVRMLTS
ncbi:MAG TPA: pyridoxal 5'-phosphate synthase glutaminase subunit PdxT [Candidatus Baltobacteraceae bacterium]|jgi:5'-phosphate synthase pdxT subunit|nr:pyridoxal 5'-phosphate synthase glutaminase subunit PdxT [Candidatus Baltobacteraceae bacterium]